jgi:hypothetical protein
LKSDQHGAKLQIVNGAPEPTPRLKVVSINDRAFDNLRYIRETMERAGSFTAVPGWGGVLMGVSALLTALLASRLESRDLWFATWLGEALLAFAIGGFSLVQKARALKTILYGPGRKFALNLFPAMIGGGVLTVVLYHNGLYALMPGIWLMFYGVAVVHGGTYSVKVVPLMGMCFMAIGAIAFVVPFEWANWCMAAGFGGLQIVFGAVIARRYGG